MTDAPELPGDGPSAQPDLATRIHRWVAFIIATVIGIDLVVFAVEAQWLNAFLAATIMTIIVAPALLRDHLPVRLPAEMQLVALAFVFAALFLGEIRSYYERIWWWDILLHISSGWLLGAPSSRGTPASR